MRKWLRDIPHLFAKCVVLFCVGFAAGCSLYALRILSRTGHDPSALLGVILGFFGGELLFLCLRSIVRKKAETKEEEEHERLDEEGAEP